MGNSPYKPSSAGLRVLHVTPSFAPAWSYGGPIESLDQICRNLARAGCDVRVLTTNTAGRGLSLQNVAPNRETEVQPGLRVCYCSRMARVSVSPSMVRRLPSYLREADVIHLTGVFNFPTFPTLLACAMAKKPLVWSPRGALQQWPGRRRPTVKCAWEWLCQRLAPAHLTLHVTSEAEARESRGHLGEAEIAIVPNGVAIPERLLDHVARPDHQLRLMFLGRLELKKGIENLLEAVRVIAEGSKLDLRLTIVGGGAADYVKHLRQRVIDLNLTDRVTMTGEKTGTEKEEIFASADVLLMPSYVENFGNVIAEALARAVPVIASTGSPWSKVESVGCGLWVDNSVGALIDAISRISTMPLREMGARGRRWMIEQFGWDVIALRMIDCYRNTLAAAAGAAPMSHKAQVGSDG